jgi:hypothetical protein
LVAARSARLIVSGRRSRGLAPPGKIGAEEAN